MRSPPLLARARSFAAALLGAVVATSCGEPATVQQCEEIVERIARLEIEQRRVQPADVDSEIEETKRALRETTMKDCVGKRVTQKAMTCVREARTSKQIVEQCFE